MNPLKVIVLISMFALPHMTNAASFRIDVGFDLNSAGNFLQNGPFRVRATETINIADLSNSQTFLGLRPDSLSFPPGNANVLGNTRFDASNVGMDIRYDGNRLDLRLGGIGQDRLDASRLSSTFSTDWLVEGFSSPLASISPGQTIALSLTGTIRILRQGQFGNFAIPNNYFRITNVSSVPLPAAAWLFGSAILGLVALKRRNT